MPRSQNSLRGTSRSSTATSTKTLAQNSFGIALSLVFRTQLFYLVHVAQCGRSTLCILKKIGMSGFRVKIESRRFTFVPSRCRRNLKIVKQSTPRAKIGDKMVPPVQHDYRVSSFKDGAYYCYCPYLLRISRYSDFLSVIIGDAY